MGHGVFFISLGCDKNLVDSEVMIGELKARGYDFCDDIDDADAVVVNTCCFIGDAKEESINTILEVADLKTEGKISYLIVAGCLAQRYSEEIREQIPETDAVIGTASTGAVADTLDALYSGEKNLMNLAPTDSPLYMTDVRYNTFGFYYAYLKIAEGCDKRCTYCIIPSLRGPYRSYTVEYLVKEAEKLAGQGVSELILVAQETTIYGTDIYGKKLLAKLLKELSGIEGIHWIRIMYCYPEEIDDELIETIATLPKVCHYIDMPIQHSSDSILKRMGRRTDCESIRAIIARLRKRIPDICIRTTLISGFPGETQEDFEELYRFVNDVEFDRLGVFAYSPEEDTPAAGFDGQIPDDVKEFRKNELMELQQEICFDNSEKYIGKKMEAVIHGFLPSEDVYVARTYRDAPDIDGFVYIPYDRERMSGEYVNVLITKVKDYDLIGEIIDESAQ